MAKYTTAPAEKAEWSGAGYPADTGNPTLTHVYEDGKWLCSCDGENAERIKNAVRILALMEEADPKQLGLMLELLEFADFQEAKTATAE